MEENKVCPYCGKCGHCGQPQFPAYPVYPVYPGQPYYPVYPKDTTGDFVYPPYQITCRSETISESYSKG